MPLVAILGLYALLAFPSGSGMLAAEPQASALEAQPQQDAPQAASPKEPGKPGSGTQEQPKSDEERKTDSSAQQTTEPPPAQQPETQQPQVQPQVAPPDSQAKNPGTPASPSTGTKSKKSTHKRKPVTPPTADPPKVVVKNGSTTDPAVQISPGLSKQQASNQRQTTDLLLNTTDENLKKISGKQLTPGQQETVNQVRKYVEQAKAAVDAGDYQRAHNLASKAQLLSDELIKQQ